MFRELSTWVAEWIFLVPPRNFSVSGYWALFEGCFPTHSVRFSFFAGGGDYLGGDWVAFPTHSVGF